MNSTRTKSNRTQWHRWVLALAVILMIFPAGCGHVAGNYPPTRLASEGCTASFDGTGFLLRAGSRLPVEKVEAELGSLRDQGYSRHDPQIIKSVARRKDVPPGLLTDRSGCAYYRMTVRLKPGVGLSLDPGALEITVATETGTMVLCDQGYVLVDRRLPAGCLFPSNSPLDLGFPATLHDQTTEFLVRLPVRGKIVALDLVPQRFKRLETPDQGQN